MQLKLLTVASLAGAAYSQSLNEVLGSTSQVSALAGLIQRIPGLGDQLNNARNITILAPSNEAINALISSPQGRSLQSQPQLAQAILQYHVLNGTYPASAITNTSAFVPTSLTDRAYTNVTGGQRIEARRIGGNVTFFSGALANSSVVQADVNFTGGVVHIVNRVLTLPLNISSTAVAANLTAVAGALTTANLVQSLDQLRDVTVFAPNNAAFQAIAGATANLSVADLTGILSYHVVNGTVGYSSGLSNGASLRTLGGQNLTIRIENGAVYVNNAQVTIPNVLVANGVVHVIDQVLSPNNTNTSRGPAIPSASGTNVPFTSGVPTPTATLVVPSGAPGASSAASAAASGTSSALAAPMMTAGVGMAALFGAAGAVMNI